MNVAERIRLCKLLEQMKEDPEYAGKLGLKDRSSYKKKQIKKTIKYLITE